MKVIGSVFACITLAALLGCTSAESYSRRGYDFSRIDKVAVVNVTGSVENEAAFSKISDFFVMELLEKGYSPVALSQIQELLREQFPEAELIPGK